MTKLELIEKMKNVPDNAEVELSIPNPYLDGRVWYAIDDIEYYNQLKESPFCFIIAGDQTMG